VVTLPDACDHVNFPPCGMVPSRGRPLLPCKGGHVATIYRAQGSARLLRETDALGDEDVLRSYRPSGKP
jgi:hypothetical protein